MVAKPLNGWEKLLCLIWKDWCVQWRNWHIVLFCIFSPTFLMSMPIIIRSMISCEKFPNIMFEPIDLEESWNNLVSTLSSRSEKYFNVTPTPSFNVYVPQMVIAYAPNNYTAFNTIMTDTSKYLIGMKIIGYKSCELLDNAMQVEHYFAGVCFNYNGLNNTQNNTNEKYSNIPSPLIYNLIFPSELRIYHDTYIGSNWDTNNLFDFVTSPVSRIGNDKTGGYVGYVREGFIFLQHRIYLAYMNQYPIVEILKKLYNKTTHVPDVLLRRFPHSAYTNDEFLNGVKKSLSLIIIISYTSPVTIFIKYILEEKENNLQSVLRYMGASHALQLISWCVVGFFQLFLSSILLVTLIKIPWSDGYAVLANSSWLALFVIMCFYNLFTVAFTIFITIFFVDTKKGVIMTTALWVLSFFPYASFLNKLNQKIVNYILIFLLPNTTMGLIINSIQNLEQFDDGIHFYNCFNSHTLEVHFSTGILTIIMLLQSIVLIIIAIYVETLKTGNIYRERKPSLSMRTSSRRGLSSKPHITDSVLRNTTIIEVESVKPPILEINHLYKQYKNDYVVNNVNMILYENDTTILMGHNGCGKTTLLKMIVGLIRPSSGHININGVKRSAYDDFDDIGIALNDKLLFKNLTVQDQLLLFCRMKGVPYVKCKMEIGKYLQLTPLKNNLNRYTDDLTSALKNILALCCALIGDSKIVILYNPFDGLDILTRKHMWNLLLKERIGRTLLIATNNYEVAQAFGDRVAIMANGEIKCFGKPNFLKHVYCYGYCLTILLGHLSQTEEITKLFQKYIENIKPDYKLGNEISFVLEQKFSSIFDDLLDELERRSYELNILSLELYEHSLRDVYVQHGADDPSYGSTPRHQQILNGISKNLDFSNPVQLFDTYECVKGRKLILNHWHAYFYKRFTYFIRNKLLFLLTFTLPVICLLMPVFILRLNSDRKDLSPITYSVEQYQYSTFTVEFLRNTDLLSESVELEYEHLVFWNTFPHYLKIIETPFEQYILERNKLKIGKNKEHYIVAVSFQGNYTAWFSNYPLHSAPLSLNLIHNAIVRTLLGYDAIIEIKFQPLPFTNKRHRMMMHFPPSQNIILPLCTSLCLSFIWSITIIFLIREKYTNFKFLQFIAGAKRDLLLLTSLVYEIMVVFLTAIITVITMIIIDQNRFNDTNVIISYFLTIMAGGICVTSMNHVLAKFFRDPLTAFCVVYAIHVFGITSFAIFTEVFYRHHEHALKPINTLEWMLYTIPLFTQCRSLTSIIFIQDLKSMCADEILNRISRYVENCNVLPNCCIEYSVWSFKNGVTLRIFILLGITFLFLLSTYLMINIKTCDIFNFKRRAVEKILRENNLKQYKFSREVHKHLKVNHEVIQEQIFVSKMNSENLSVNPLTCKNVTKIYNKRTLLNQICLSVKEHECVCITGVNNSGKSTLLKIMAGVTNTDYGEVIVRGHSSYIEQDEANKYIGYSPKNLILLREYKVYEFLYIICLLRGMPKNKIKNTSENLAKALSIYDELNKYIGDISNGVKKRVCLLTAILGNTGVILLDEPTIHADPSAQRIIWNVICQLKESGRACIIKTHLIDEVLYLCDRLAVLGTNGAFSALASLEGIRDKYVDSYIIEVTMKNVAHNLTNISGRRSSRLKRFITKRFPGSFIVEILENNIIFVIPDNEDVKMSTIFKEMQTNVSNLSVDYFVIKKTPIKPLIRNLIERSTCDY